MTAADIRNWADDADELNNMKLGDVLRACADYIDATAFGMNHGHPLKDCPVCKALKRLEAITP